jgi:hypothetical protein
MLRCLSFTCQMPWLNCWHLLLLSLQDVGEYFQKNVLKNQVGPSTLLSTSTGTNQPTVGLLCCGSSNQDAVGRCRRPILSSLGHSVAHKLAAP